jgi:hypothetical protein
MVAGDGRGTTARELIYLNAPTMQRVIMARLESMQRRYA